MFYRDSSQSGDNMSDSETEEDGGVAIPSCDAHLPSLYHTSTKLRHRRKDRAETEAEGGGTQEEEDVGSDLDDAELNQYIATESEVCVCVCVCVCAYACMCVHVCVCVCVAWNMSISILISVLFLCR